MKTNLIDINGYQVRGNIRETILISLFNAGIESPNQCQSGFCGTCRCKLISGEIDYITSPIAYLRQNEILSCVAIPKSDIEIFYNTIVTIPSDHMSVNGSKKIQISRNVK